LLRAEVERIKKEVPNDLFSPQFKKSNVEATITGLPIFIGTGVLRLVPFVPCDNSDARRRRRK